MHITVICAWCGKFIGTKDAGGLDANAPRISHSICPACAKRVQSAAYLMYNTGEKISG
jgi:hypothetical protein